MPNRRALMLLGSATLIAAWVRPRVAHATAERAIAFVKSTADRILAAMRGSGSVEERRRVLAPIIDDAIDVDGIAQFCLGRFWRTATPDQQKRYTELFHKVLIGNITARLGEYQEVKLTIGRSQPRDEYDIVSSTIDRASNPPAKVDWVVSDTAGRPKVVDVIAEGTSLRLTQRSDYAAFLVHNNNDVDALINAMRQQLDQGSG